VTGCKEGESSKKNAVPGHAAQKEKCTVWERPKDDQYEKSAGW